MDPPSAPELTDEALAAEIVLLGDLVLAASRVPGRLTQDEVDQVLKLVPPDCGPQPAPGEAPHGAV